jgi:RNA methyltransferase, TrmH family
MMRDVSTTLASPSNPRIKSVARLRDRRERDATGLTLVDGAREARRALESGIEVVEAFICEPMLAGEDARIALDRLRALHVAVTTTSDAAFSKIAFGERAEGLLLVVRIPSMRLDDLALPAEPLIVVVEAVEKPGNLGAILRSADWLAARDIRIVAAKVDAETAYTDADLRGPLAIALGSEADGLTGAWNGAPIQPVRVPMAGIADSLNVSVTAAVLLYEARRQRGRHANRRD